MFYISFPKNDIFENILLFYIVSIFHDSHFLTFSIFQGPKKGLGPKSEIFVFPSNARKVAKYCVEKVDLTKYSLRLLIGEQFM